MAYLNGHELFFGVTATVGGGSVIGTPQAAQGDPKSLTVTTFELTYGKTMCEDFLSGLPWEWDYTADGERHWGNLVLREKSSKLYFSNNYLGTDMGNAIQLTTGTVTVVKSSKAMLVLAPVSKTTEHPYDIIAVGTMTGADGTEYKAMATDTAYSSSTSTYVFALDDTNNSELVYLSYRSGNYAGAPKKTTQTDALISPFLDNANLSAVWKDVLFTAACADFHKTGLYTVGDSNIYYGYNLALKDGG